MVFKPWTLAFNCTRARLSKSPDASKPDELGERRAAFASRGNVSRPTVATIEGSEKSLTQSDFSFTPGFNRVTGPNTSSHTKNRFNGFRGGGQETVETVSGQSMRMALPPG